MLLAPFIFAVAYVQLRVFLELSPYIYEHPRHHCPFCILKAEHGYIVYLLYIPLFGATTLALLLCLQAAGCSRTQPALERIKPVQDLSLPSVGAMSAQQIDAIGVTEYYSVQRIDARTAFYVIGSDVLGLMGHELIPLENETDALEFLQDHAGTRILHFNEVTLPLLDDLDRVRF